MWAGNIFLPLLSIQINLILALITEEFSISINEIIDGDSDIFSQAAYVQTGSELYYFKDISYQDSPILPISADYKKELSSSNLDSKHNEQRNIQLFREETTDFGKTAFGIPVLRKIHVYNPSNADIFFDTIITSGFNFHCSNLEKQPLSPKQNALLRVYFLPTVDEPVIKEETIIFQTSIGKFAHKLRGESVGNPYRLRSNLGLSIPLNATFTAPIQLHNPHPQTMHILDIFSSDCHVHVEHQLPYLDFDQRTNKHLEPFETKKVAVAKIMGDTERNTTSFLFIKLRLIEKPKKNRMSSGGFHIGSSIITLVTLIDIEVTKRKSLFTTIHMFDFGLIRAGEQLSPLKLSLYSTLERGIEIDSVNTGKQHGFFLQFETRPPIPIKPGFRGQPGDPVKIASINIDTNLLAKEISQSDEIRLDENVVKKEDLIIAESRGGNYNITVPVKATIYKGSLICNTEDVYFHKDLMPVIKRDIMITNSIPYTLTIYSIEIARNAQKIFNASLIFSPLILSIGQSLAAVKLHYLKKQPAGFSTYIILHTNLSSFKVPISIFHGKLEIKLLSLEQREFNFGAVKSDESRSITFTLYNHNPVPLNLQLYVSSPDIFYVKLCSIHKIEKTKQGIHGGKDYKKGENFNLPTSSLKLTEYSFAIFKLHFFLKITKRKIPLNENQIIRIKTQFSAYEYPVYFELVNSTQLMNVQNKIIFDGVFTGTVTTQPLVVRNNSPKELRLLRISVPNEDPRFLLNVNSQLIRHNLILTPGIPMNIANITFLPEAVCPLDCYLGMPLSTSDGQWFAYGMKLPHNLAEIDNYLFSRLRRKWFQLKEKVVKTSVNLDTNWIRGLEVPVEANFIWPRLLSHSVVHFPLTAVGNFSIVNLTLTNPTTSSIIVQLLPLVIYPDADTLIELFHDELPAPLIDPIEVNETLMFSLRDTELFTLKAGSPVPQLRDEVEKIVEGSIPRFTQSILLRPGMTARIRIGFLPSDYSLRSSLLVIRNNLTALEPVVLYGRGAKINMEIDNKTARTQPLLFELEPQHLNDCANPRRQLHRMPTTLTVRRSFAIRNCGEVGFSVVNISVNGIPCENRGYRVLNCDRFKLEPNEVTFLDIAFTPDFMFSVSEATLQLYIHMNATPWAFNLAAVIPKHLLSMCYSALPRPPFEALMYQTCVLALIFCLICVISCAYLEGDRVIMIAYKQQFLLEYEGEVFDLNALEPNIYDYIDIKEILKNLKKREFLQISTDAGIIKKLFWRTMNFILWVFSYIWPLIRSEQINSTPKKSLQKSSKIIHSFQRVLGTDAHEYFDSSHSTNIPATLLDDDGFEDVSVILDKASFYWDKDKMMTEPNYMNDDSSLNDDISSEDVNNHPAKPSRRRRDILDHKITIQEDFISANSLPSNIRDSKKINIAEESKLNIKITTGLKNKKETHSRGFHIANSSQGPIEQFTRNLKTFDSSSCSEGNLSSRIFSNPSGGKDKTLFCMETPFSADVPLYSKNSSVTPPKQSIQSKYNQNYIGENFIPSQSSSISSEIEENISSTSNLDDNKITNYDDGERMSENSSDIPEWADEAAIKGNVEDEFSTLATKSAQLFGDDYILNQEEIGANINPFYTIQNNRIDQQNSKKNTIAKKKKVTKNQDLEADRIIAQLTQEYRERLVKIFKGRKHISDFFKMPPDLTPYIGESDNSGGSSPNVKSEDLSNNKMKEHLRRKSPGSELRKSWNLESGSGHNNKNESCFLFNISDPIWKPIGEFDQVSAPAWPDFATRNGEDKGNSSK